MNFTLKLNNEVLSKKIHQAIAKSPIAKEAALKAFRAFYYPAKNNMMRQFDRHNVTQEIAAGPQSANISQTLEGYELGNLFTFIGFPDGDQPIERLRAVLLSTTYQQGQLARGYKTDGLRTVFGWNFKVLLPSRSDIKESTDMPWEQGNSWAFGIERGIAGLSHYMYKNWDGPNSRSKHAFQLPYENMEDAAFKPVPYITEILSNFRERMNKQSVA